MTTFSTQFNQAITHLTMPESNWLKQSLRSLIYREAELDTDEQHDAIAKAMAAELGIDESLIESWPGFGYHFAGTKQTLWLFSRDTGDVDNLIILLEKFFAKFRPAKSMIITWAVSCSSFRVGGFSGGSHTVNAKAKETVLLPRDLVEEVTRTLIMIDDIVGTYEDSKVFKGDLIAQLAAALRVD